MNVINKKVPMKICKTVVSNGRTKCNMSTLLLKRRTAALDSGGSTREVSVLVIVLSGFLRLFPSPSMSSPDGEMVDDEKNVL